jgi:hypothetical protein
VRDLPLVPPVLHNIATFVLGLIQISSANEREYVAFAFWAWLTSLKMMFSSSIHLHPNDKISFFFVAE